MVLAANPHQENVLALILLVVISLLHQAGSGYQVIFLSYTEV